MDWRAAFGLLVALLLVLAATAGIAALVRAAPADVRDGLARTTAMSERTT